MGGLEREYRAQRGFIDACEDVGALMTWMREYRDESRAAAGRGDRRASARYDDLAERAEDRVVELKAARRAAPLLARVKEWPAAPTPPPVDPEHEALRRQAEDAERRRVAAEERAARVQEEATRAAEAHARELARLRAEELTRARVAPTPVHAAPSRPVVAPSPVAPARTKPAAARGAPVARPAPPAPAPEAEAEELTPLARLFQEAITETRPTRKAPSLPPKVTAALDPAPVPDELPLLTGANLASYRAWLGVSQRALAARFGVEQGTISKGESHPRALLGPTLRRALHLAMGQPREDGPTLDAPSSLAS